MSHAHVVNFPGRQGGTQFTDADLYNQQYNSNDATELISMVITGIILFVQRSGWYYKIYLGVCFSLIILVPCTVAQEAHTVRYKARPFDWFICSVIGYMCCCWTGICAMYYSIRANHAVDWERDGELISNHTKKAKILTLLSIGLGTAVVVILIIVLVVMISSAKSAVDRMESYGGYQG